MDEARWIEGLLERGPFGSVEEARAALMAVVQVLGQRLYADEAKLVAQHLPESVRAVLMKSASAEEFDLDEFYRRVAQLEDTTLGRASEHTQIITQRLFGLMPTGDHERLRRHLPEYGDLLLQRTPPARPEGPEVLRGSVAAGSTLASGRLGSQHPLSSGRPPDHVQAHSVVQSDNPHGDTKLSSAHGLTQEREARSLATAKPRPSS